MTALTISLHVSPSLNGEVVGDAHALKSAVEAAHVAGVAECLEAHARGEVTELVLYLAEAVGAEFVASDVFSAYADVFVFPIIVAVDLEASADLRLIQEILGINSGDTEHQKY